jgi:hypothetical protein
VIERPVRLTSEKLSRRRGSFLFDQRILMAGNHYRGVYDMKFTSLFHYFWKVPLCGLLFFIGLIPGNLLADWMGLPTPGMPVGADEATVGQYTVLASLILALGLAALARGLSGGFLSRWLILFFFTWIAYGVNNYFEAVIFTTTSAASPYMIVLYLPASLLCGAAVAWLFPPDKQGRSFFNQAKAFFGGRTIED